MPWLPIYATARDFEVVRDLLNSDEQIAFLVTAGPARWLALAEVSELPYGRHGLWHVPSGPLPLLGHDIDSEPSSIADPWSGWTESRPGVDPTTPYFGPGHPGIIWLNARAPQSVDGIALSSFEWIGNWYSIIGQAAPKITEKWWQSLRRRFKKLSEQVPRGGPRMSTRAEIYALPDARHRLAEGGVAEIN